MGHESKLLDDINGTAAYALKHSWNTVTAATLVRSCSTQYSKVNEPEANVTLINVRNLSVSTHEPLSRPWTVK